MWFLLYLYKCSRRSSFTACDGGFVYIFFSLTLKDQKPNFKNNPKVRLINSAKNEIGRIGKNMLDKINHQLKDSLRINQWKDTNGVIEWFTKIPDKNRYKFAIFDIKNFYPSI